MTAPSQASNKTSSNEAYDDAVWQQRMAADQGATRLASANAGSGKTRVLVDRVSRLLLRGSEPSDILCLTYTKAAATEMQDRLFKKLGEWSVLAEADLKKALEALFGKPFSEIYPVIDIDRARQLFAEALETPEGLKVQTIHAFCEHLLSRFPVEAGIMPGFEPMDDEEQREMRVELRQEMLREAQKPKQAELREALKTLALARADKTLDDILIWACLSPEHIRRWKAVGGTQKLGRTLALKGPYKVDDIIKNTFAKIDKPRIQSLVKILQSSTLKGDHQKAELIHQINWGAAPANIIDALKPLFFTTSHTLRKSFYSEKNTPEAAKAILDDLADLIVSCEFECRKAATLNLTQSIFTIACYVADLYKARKHARRVLDFSDQILLIRNLLQNAEAADWVKYKLDGGIEHILLDEAQDTSPEQWDIIDELSAPFFQDHPNRNPREPRTLFAVGDEKQSIYSFQGADPQQFLDKIRYYLNKGLESGQKGLGEIRMRMSFRSAQAILDVVDEILIDGGALRTMFPDDYPPGSDIIRHIAKRDDQGSVELWPVIMRAEEEPDKEPWDTTPVDALSETHQRVRLAKLIAQTIRMWIDRGEPIFDRELGRTRPMHAGDVLILVQRRNSFFDAMIKQLKNEDVPVAGADRLVLKDAIIVKDLLSLARFVLLPSDDLSLAEVLKSPLIDMDDAGLFQIAKDRGAQSLWESLQNRDTEIADLLRNILGDHVNATPYQFFTKTLERLDKDGVSLRQKYFKRLSMEAREALDAFLASALDHQYRLTPSLHHFVKSFENTDIQIKRDLDISEGQARVMTVHGAKGLEAPIVFLPDTTTLQTNKDPLTPFEGGFVWAGNQAERPEEIEPYVKAAGMAAYQEQLRLLYVAMTRAESRLIICGFDSGNSKTGIKGYSIMGGQAIYEEELSWYGWVQRAFENLPLFDINLTSKDGTTITAKCFGAKPDISLPKAGARTDEKMPIPAWARQSVAPEGFNSALSPSRLMQDNYDSDHVRASARNRRARRGQIIHKLLELLPDVTVEKRKDVAIKILHQYPSLNDQERREIGQEVFAVLQHPDFSHLFASGSLSEISVTGTSSNFPDNIWMNGQIDRLCVTATEVLIIDYKSDENPPETAEAISQTYRLQLAAYHAMVEEIYPDRQIRSAILWTAIPKIMVIPDPVLQEALQILQTLPKS